MLMQVKGERDMKLSHPFEWFSESGQKRAFVLWAALALLAMASLQVLGGPLKTEAAPMGIISFEFAGELSKAQSMVKSWGEQGQVYAGLNLGLDYLFMVAYATAIGLGCVLASRPWAKRVAFLASVGLVLSWGQLLAASLDAVENYALIRVLLGSTEELWPLVARWCAIVKFLLVGAGLVYVLSGAALAIVGARSSREGRN
jgi:hypothetical protein